MSSSYISTTGPGLPGLVSGPVPSNYMGPHPTPQTYHTQPIPGYTYSQHIPEAVDPWAAPIDGLDELCEMLGVSEGGQPPLLAGVSGVRYSLVNVLRAQMELMVRLNVLLVHRRLVPDE